MWVVCTSELVPGYSAKKFFSAVAFVAVYDLEDYNTSYLAYHTRMMPRSVRTLPERKFTQLMEREGSNFGERKS